MSEEIKKQYANGFVNADEIIKSLIDKFKIDKTSVDIQQLQLIAEYLLYKVDKLQKDNYKLDRENQHFFDRIQDLQKENEELKKNGISKDLIREKRNDLIDEYFTKFVDNKDIYLAIDIIDEILNDSEVKKCQQ